MFKSAKKSESTAPIHSLLGKDTVWQGEIHSGTLPLRIEGTVEGTIHSEGEVTVAPSGLVMGTIKAKHLIVTGKVRGVMDITECLEIHGTGCVEGDVMAGALVVDEGGTLQGTSTRRGHTPEEPVKPKKEKEPKPIPATGPAEELPVGKGKKVSEP